MKKNLFICFIMLFMMSMGSCTSEPDNKSSNSGSNNSGGGSGSDDNSSTDYTFYKTVSALEIVEVHSKVTGTSIVRIDLYKHKSKVYMGHRSGASTYYNLTQYNSSSNWGDVNVSSYSYMSLKSPSSSSLVSYYYFYNY